MINELLSLAQAEVVRTGSVWTFSERVTVVVRPLVGLAVVLGIYAFVRRNPWPRPFRLGFAALHVFFASTVGFLWILVSRLIEALFLGWGSTVPYEGEFFVLAMVAYVVVAGISYSVESTARAARAEAAAASTQLAALRSQLHPHFLFNALHTVVQLIPVNPSLAMEAAEIVADLLRSSLEEQRDEVPLADEWQFVSRYLTMERIRFGDRLLVREALPAELLDAALPTFALQTLVENAVRHGAAPRVEPTEILVSASEIGSALTVTVRNSCATTASVAGPSDNASTGTGLARLRERLVVLYGNAATLTCASFDGGYEATLVVPQSKSQSQRAGVA